MIVCNLEHLLESRGLTQKAFADLSGIHKNTVNRLCMNTYKMVSADTMERICDTLGCKLSDVFIVIKAPK